MSENEFDYIVVGGGSAGCLLANRLSKDPDHRVLLLEAGGDDKSPLIKMPIGFTRLGSIFPLIPSGDTHAPVVAVADRAADLILRKPVLQPGG